MFTGYQQKLKQLLSIIDNKAFYAIEINGVEIKKGGSEFRLYCIINAKYFTDEAWEVLLSLEQPQEVLKPKKKKKNGDL